MEKNSKGIISATIVFLISSISTIHANQSDITPIITLLLFDEDENVEIVDIQSGHSNSCALLSNGIVKCWGTHRNEDHGILVSNLDGSPKIVPDLSGVKAIAVGRFHQCALLADGKIKCWGNNHLGQLGNGTTDHSETPVDVIGIDDAVSISSKYFHSCATLLTNRAKCWGANGSGQLGDGTTEDSSTPVIVGRLISDTFTDIATGNFHTCGLNRLAGNVSCWGGNSFGQIGNGTTRMATLPDPVGGVITNAISVSAGFYHTCVVTHNGVQVWCWGLNMQGQLGDGTNDNSSIARSVIGLVSLERADEIFLGGFHSCVKSTTHEFIKCWGDNEFGQLGNNTYIDSNRPVSVINLNNPRKATAGLNFNCMLDASKDVYCWGDNTERQLFPLNKANSPTPVKVGGLDYPA